MRLTKPVFGWIMKADKGNTSNGYATLELRDSPNLVGGAVLLFLQAIFVSNYILHSNYKKSNQ